MKSSPPKNPGNLLKSPYFITGAAIVIVIMLGVALDVIDHRNVASTTTHFASPEPSPSPSVPLASPTPSVTPTPSASPTATSTVASQLPAAAQTTVSGFYTAYEASDTAKIATYFTADSTPDLQSAHDLLFTGKDVNGVPGGPTLFVSSTVLEHPTSYSVTLVVQIGASWQLTVQEHRVDGTSKALAAENLTLVLAQNSDGTWGIAQYSHTNSSDKYNGFFTD